MSNYPDTHAVGSRKVVASIGAMQAVRPKSNYPMGRNPRLTDGKPIGCQRVSPGKGFPGRPEGPRKNKLRICVDGQWQNRTVCIDPDLCRNGETRPGTAECPDDELLVIGWICVGGRWENANPTVCTEPDTSLPNILIVISDDVGAEASSTHAQFVTNPA